MRRFATVFFLLLCLFSHAQEKDNLNSATRKFINGADFTQVNKDWNVTADFRSGIGEQVSFFPVEAINLKTNEKLNPFKLI